MSSIDQDFLEAARSGGTESMLAMLSRGVDVNAKNENHFTVLHFMASTDNSRIIKELIKNGADIEIKSRNGTTPLHIAARTGNGEAIMALLGCKANIEAKNNSGETALHEAVWSPHASSTVSLLIKNQANLDAQDGHGWTALHRAAWSGANESITTLLKHGAKVDTPDNHGQTALRQAVHQKHLETIAILLERGANIEAVDENGFTAVTSTTDAQTTLFLLAHGADALKAKPEFRCISRKQAAVMGAFDSRLVALLGADFPQNISERDSDLLEFAIKNQKPSSAAIIQSKMAMDAINGIRGAAKAHVTTAHPWTSI